MTTDKSISQAWDELIKAESTRRFYEGPNTFNSGVNFAIENIHLLPKVAILISALELYMASRRVVEKELDWDLYESLEAALKEFKGDGA